MGPHGTLSDDGGRPEFVGGSAQGSILAVIRMTLLQFQGSVCSAKAQLMQISGYIENKDEAQLSGFSFGL